MTQIIWPAKSKYLVSGHFQKKFLEPILDRENTAVKKNNQIPMCLQVLLFLRQQCLNAYCLRGSPSWTQGITVDATARGLQGTRTRMTGVETDVQEQVRERRCWESGLVSVETSWNRQATGMPPAGPPNPRSGQEPHVSESPGDMISKAGEQAPPRNLNGSSRGRTELPPSWQVPPRDSEARSSLKGTGLGFGVSEWSKAPPEAVWPEMHPWQVGGGKESGHRHWEVDAVKRQFIVY